MPVSYGEVRKLELQVWDQSDLLKIEEQSYEAGLVARRSPSRPMREAEYDLGGEEAAHLQYTVLTSRLKAGRTEVRVLSETQPSGMAPATPGLEDVYFATLHQHGLSANLE